VIAPFDMWIQLRKRGLLIRLTIQKVIINLVGENSIQVSGKHYKRKGEFSVISDGDLLHFIISDRVIHKHF
jgi:hypothetical protein